MNKEIKEKIIVIILILILIRIIAFFIYKNENKLKSKGNQKEGIIYEIGHVKGNHSCRFRFNHDAKIILGSSGSPRLVNTDFNKFKYNLDSLIGYKFRVYYDPKDPENNYMDFNEFLGIDSTLWKAARRINRLH
jgi:hypothetical protein